MVCLPCFIIPLLLYIWHKFVQPILLRYWNPWEKKDAQGNVIKAGPEFPFECKGGVCPYVPGANKLKGEAARTDAEGTTTESTTTTTSTSTTTTTSKTELTTSEPEFAAESKKQI